MKIRRCIVTVLTHSDPDTGDLHCQHEVGIGMGQVRSVGACPGHVLMLFDSFCIGF
jgi:hypothetical protein